MGFAGEPALWEVLGLHLMVQYGGLTHAVSWVCLHCHADFVGKFVDVIGFWLTDLQDGLELGFRI